MEKSQNIEEILESLWVHSQEKNQESVDIGSLHKEDQSLLGHMEAHDLIFTRNGKIYLTKKGQEYGRDVIRRHRLAELLLTEVLDITEKTLVHETACSFEHILSKGIADKICTLLGHPQHCPHGKPIPPGQCCIKKDLQPGQIVSLAKMKPGTVGKIAYLHTNNSLELKKLMAMGLFPGTIIQLLQKFPSYVFKTGYTQFAVDKKIADEIFVNVRTK